MMKSITLLISCLCCISIQAAEVPRMIPHQGRITVDSVNFDGTGTFKFLIYRADPKPTTTPLWNNESANPNNLSEPAAGVSLPVTKGLYSIQLGAPPQAALPADLSAASDEQLMLRIWFDDGVNGSQLLSPDQSIGAVPFALTAGNALSQSQLLAAGFVKKDSEGNITIPGKIKTPAPRVFKKLIPVGAIGLQQAIQTSGPAAGGQERTINQPYNDTGIRPGAIRSPSGVVVELTIPIELPIGSSLTNIGVYMADQAGPNKIIYSITKASFEATGSTIAPVQVFDSRTLPANEQPMEPASGQMGDFLLPTPITIEDSSFYSLYYNGFGPNGSIYGFVLTYTHDALTE